MPLTIPKDWLKQVLKWPTAAALLAICYLLYLFIDFIIGSTAEKINDIHAKAQAIPTIQQDHADMRGFFQSFTESQRAKEEEQTQAIIQSCKVSAKAFRQNPEDCIPKP